MANNAAASVTTASAAAASGKSLCYSIADNDYFQLNGNVQPSPDADVYLTRRIDSSTLARLGSGRGHHHTSFNMTAMLSYCNEPTVIAPPFVLFTVYSVTK